MDRPASCASRKSSPANGIHIEGNISEQSRRATKSEMASMTSIMAERLLAAETAGDDPKDGGTKEGGGAGESNVQNHSRWDGIKKTRTDFRRLSKQQML